MQEEVPVSRPGSLTAVTRGLAEVEERLEQQLVLVDQLATRKHDVGQAQDQVSLLRQTVTFLRQSLVLRAGCSDAF